MLTNSVSFLSGGFILLLLCFVFDWQPWFSPSLENFAFLAYLGLVITGLAYLLYFEGMKKISASKASGYFFLKPALASLFAFLILREKLSGFQIIGIVFIIISLNRAVIDRLFRLTRLKIS